MKVKRIHKIVIAVVAVAVVLGGGVWLLFPQLPALWNIKWSLRQSEHPELYLVAVDRQVAAAAVNGQADHPTLPVQGLTFISPFSGTPVSKAYNTTTKLTYPQGEVLMLMDRRAEPSLLDLLAMGGQNQAQSVMEVFGAQNVSGKYAFVKQILAVTPEQVAWNAPQQRVQAQQILLAFKAMTVAKTNDLFRFDLGDIKGFQYGSPDKGDHKVIIDLYTAKDDNFTLSLAADNLTQQAVDEFLRSIRVNE